MTTRLLLLFSVLFATPLYSQEYKKLRLQVGVGHGIVEQNYNSSERSGIVVIYAEPSYRIMQRIALGIRLEGGGSLNGGNFAIASYGLNGQYYISAKRFRPFCGLGIGYYYPMSTLDSYYGFASRNEKWVIGFYPRAGFDFGHLTALLEANVVSSFTTILTPINGSAHGNYISFKIGVNIGGGRKK